MKKVLSVLLAFSLVAALLCGCIAPEPVETVVPDTRPNLGTDLTLYPIYDNLSDEDKIIWDNICTAIRNHSTEPIHIGTYTGVADIANAEKRISMMYRELVYACPDYFWVDLYDFKVISTQEGNATHIELELHYVLDEATAREYKPVYDAKVNEIVTAAREIPDLFDRVLYVYDTIINGTVYDNELAELDDLSHLNLSAYGCLVAGKTVCSGYALAFRSIMDKLGIECGVEFNSYQYYTAWSVGHVWNYCKLDDEYYYFDLTWDDDPSGTIYHLFFGLTRDDMVLASYYLNDVSPVPECAGTKYNYYRYQGLSFATYDYEAVKPVIQAHKNDDYILLRFDTPEEAKKAEEDLINNQKIFQILPSLRSLHWSLPTTDLHLMLILN